MIGVWNPAEKSSSNERIMVEKIVKLEIAFRPNFYINAFRLRLEGIEYPEIKTWHAFIHSKIYVQTVEHHTVELRKTTNQQLWIQLEASCYVLSFCQSFVPLCLEVPFPARPFSFFWFFAVVTVCSFSKFSSSCILYTCSTNCKRGLLQHVRFVSKYYYFLKVYMYVHTQVLCIKNYF